MRFIQQRCQAVFFALDVPDPDEPGMNGYWKFRAKWFFVTFGELTGFKDYHSAQQFKSSSSIHSPFDIFQSVNLSFDLSITIWS